MPLWLTALCGFAIGGVAGLAVRRGRLCSFSAIESGLLGGDWRQMKAFALALAIALAGTQGMVAAGLLDPALGGYVPNRVALLSAALGSLMFGLGMAFVGTCAFGSLVRLGGGDLRSLITMIFFGGFAYATLRGALSWIRLDVFERINVKMPGGAASDFATLLTQFAGMDLRLTLAALLAIALGAWALRDARFRASRRLLGASLALGLCVVAGWAATGPLADPFDDTTPRSLTFVGPVARGLFGVLGNHAEWLTFGVMSVPGVIFGAFCHALWRRDFRWEAYDDHHEMRRHITGAMLMGIGGVLAGGCTIGQGLTAASALAVTAPIAIIGMIAGARIGIAILVEGSIREYLRQRFAG